MNLPAMLSKLHVVSGKYQLLAVDAMNDPRGYMVGKRLIEMGKSPEKSVVADPGRAADFGGSGQGK